MKQTSKTFCHFPFDSISVQGTGIMNPCCEAHFHKTKEFQLPKYTMSDYWNSPELDNLRNDLLNGKQNPACKQCWREEAQGMTSKRLQQHGSTWETTNTANPKIQAINIQFTNLCNLGCRMCHHWASSVIEDENRKHHDLYHSKKYKIESDPDWHHSKSHFEELDQQRNWWADEKFLKDLYELLPNVFFMDISGGEPTLNKTFINILDHLIEIDHAKWMRLEFTTNAQQINPKLLERLHHFKHVNIFVSVDGYKDVYEYIRWKGSWDKLEKNIMWLKENANDNVSIICHQTSQVLNILNLPELLNWYQQNNINWTNINAVTRPNHHNVLVLPEDIRNIARQRWENFLQTYQTSLTPQQEMNVVNIIQSLKTTDVSYEQKWWKYFVRDTMLKDEIRNQSLEKSVPDLYELIKNNYKL